tara:strand:+ start:97 stop:1002 length:906 start_codon:yes stop_codon:yes gene_type:complete
MDSINQKEEIAFLLPVYNGEFSIERTLISILKQEYKFFKIYIINNGSIDNTLSIINKFALKDKRILIYNQDIPNLSKALCLGLDLIEEELILRIDSGDTCDIYRAKRTLEFMKKNKNCAISYTDYFIQMKDKLVFNSLPEILSKKDFLFKNKIAHSTICIRKSFLKKYNFSYAGIGKENLYYGPSQDLFILSIAIFVFNLEVAKIPNTSSIITKNIKNSISYLNKDEQRRVASIILFINNIKFLSSFKFFKFALISLFGLIINGIRLIKYGSIIKFFKLIYKLYLLNSKDKFIYQALIKIK